LQMRKGRHSAIFSVASGRELNSRPFRQDW
jgi:hypothetical protein